MVDLSDKGSESEERNNGQSPDSVKTCADCGTNKTPLWRVFVQCLWDQKQEEEKGSSGCEQRINRGGQEIEEQHKNNHKGKLGNTLRRKLLALGKEVVVQRSMVEKVRRKLGEEEQAAVLLMALSCGSVFA
ncbi:GATA transcription factor 16 [Actinidia rufa]|uniref:GATA transcription factor 16 n=1 Tax=Actinidia rufa TaxID=165716 RepID=A0A7J0HF99_9ERIC|nr:GATA transcription factor 16 [Actinidia rufa]